MLLLNFVLNLDYFSMRREYLLKWIRGSLLYLKSQKLYALFLVFWMSFCYKVSVINFMDGFLLSFITLL